VQVEHVKERCLPGGLNYPMLEEYDFRNDDVNAPLPIELKPVCFQDHSSLSRLYCRVYQPQGAVNRCSSDC